VVSVRGTATLQEEESEQQEATRLLALSVKHWHLIAFQSSEVLDWCINKRILETKLRLKL
jgi:hypothetical protein